MGISTFSNYIQVNPADSEKIARHCLDLTDRLESSGFKKRSGCTRAGRVGALTSFDNGAIEVVHYDIPQVSVDQNFASNLFIASGDDVRARIKVLRVIEDFYAELGYTTQHFIEKQDFVG